MSSVERSSNNDVGGGSDDDAHAPPSEEEKRGRKKRKRTDEERKLRRDRYAARKEIAEDERLGRQSRPDVLSLFERRKPGPKPRRETAMAVSLLGSSTGTDASVVLHQIQQEQERLQILVNRQQQELRDALKQSFLRLRQQLPPSTSLTERGAAPAAGAAGRLEPNSLGGALPLPDARREELAESWPPQALGDAGAAATAAATSSPPSLIVALQQNVVQLSNSEQRSLLQFLREHLQTEGSGDDDLRDGGDAAGFPLDNQGKVQDEATVRGDADEDQPMAEVAMTDQAMPDDDDDDDDVRLEEPSNGHHRGTRNTSSRGDPDPNHQHEDPLSHFSLAGRDPVAYGSAVLSSGEATMVIDVTGGDKAKICPFEWLCVKLDKLSLPKFMSLPHNVRQKCLFPVAARKDSDGEGKLYLAPFPKSDAVIRAYLPRDPGTGPDALLRWEELPENQRFSDAVMAIGGLAVQISEAKLGAVGARLEKAASRRMRGTNEAKLLYNTLRFPDAELTKLFKDVIPFMCNILLADEAHPLACDSGDEYLFETEERYGYMESITSHVQYPHTDYPEKDIKMFEKGLNRAFLAFFPLSEAGQHLQFWVKDKRTGKVSSPLFIYLQLGQLLMVPASTIHAGGFRSGYCGFRNKRGHIYVGVSERNSCKRGTRSGGGALPDTEMNEQITDEFEHNDDLKSLKDLGLLKFESYRQS